MIQHARKSICAGLLVIAGGCARSTWRADFSPSQFVSVRSHGSGACVARSGLAAETCHDGVAVHTITFDASGGHVAYAARYGGAWAIVRDGIAGPTWDGVATPVFSPDGRRIAYPAQVGPSWRVVVDSTAGPPFDAIVMGSLRFDPTGRRVAYVAMGGDSSYSVVDRSASVAWRAIADLAFDASGERFGYVAAVGGAWRVVVGDSVGPAYPRLHGLAFEPGTGHTLVVARNEAGRETLLRNGVPGKWHDSVDPPVVGVRDWGYIARDGDSASVIVNERVMARDTGASDLAIGTGGTYAYLTNARGQAVVVDHDGRRSSFDMVVSGTLQFMNDGATWACLAGESSSRTLFVATSHGRVSPDFAWSDLARWTSQGDAPQQVRRWVGRTAASRK